MSYNQGDRVVFYIHTNAPNYDLRIERDGGEVEKVYEQTGIAGIAQDTPEDAYTVGCGWQESLTVCRSLKAGIAAYT